MPNTNIESTEYPLSNNKNLLSESSSQPSTASRFLSDAYGWVAEHKVQLGTALAATALGSAAIWRGAFVRTAKHETNVYVGSPNSWQIIRSGYRPAPEFNITGSTNLSSYEKALQLADSALPKPLATTLQKLGKDWR